MRLVLSSVVLALTVNAIPLNKLLTYPQSRITDAPSKLERGPDGETRISVADTSTPCPKPSTSAVDPVSMETSNKDSRGRRKKHSDKSHHAGHAGYGPKRPGNGKSYGGHDKNNGQQNPHGGKPDHSGSKPAKQNKQVNLGSGDTFPIYVVNKCDSVKHVGIFGVTSTYQATQNGPSKSVNPGKSCTLNAPFHGIGLRLTANAQLGRDNVFEPQSLFEFGYSRYQDVEGTSYDLSLMEGAETGMAVDVLENGDGSGSCESKSCPSPTDCPAKQGWTNPDQINLGSPADATCYKGKTAFRVTLCP